MVKFSISNVAHNYEQRSNIIFLFIVITLKPYIVNRFDDAFVDKI